MLFASLGSVAAMWLIASPLLGLESGLRAGLAVVVGVAGLLLAPLGIRHRWANAVMVALGLLLMLDNFAQFPPLLSMASFATCAVALVAAGTAPMPVVVAPPAAPQKPEIVAVPAPIERAEDRTKRLPRAA